ncbi:MAG: M48 family metalloprotease [Gammaproteobacteria bacterium]|nr:M48 family metalloprotease [Gammaproteobacteria bacterium]
MVGGLGLARVSDAQIALPDMGDPSQSIISSADEQAIGDAFMRELRAHVDLVEDPDVVQYVYSLGYELASHETGPKPNFTFFVVQDGAINAFAAPGGYIGINSGLITTTETEGELASVVAHEIAHVTQRHIARGLEQQEKMTLPALAGLAAAILLGMQNPEAGQAAVAAVTAGQAQLMLNFSRIQEQEADRIGMQMLAGAGFDPRAMPAFFEKLQRASRYYRQPPEFLSTHPVTVSRIADTRSRADGYEYRQRPDRLEFYLVRAKLEVMQMDPQEAVRRFEDRLARGQHLSRDATRYGLALALLEGNQPVRAHELAQSLNASDPDRVPYIELLARTEVAAGRVARALDIYADALELYPGDETLTRGHVQTLLRANEPKKALRAINDYGRHQPLDAVMYRLSAQAYQQTGDRRGAHAAQAEHYYLVGKLDAAVQQLKLAIQAPGNGDDFYESSRIEARLSELQRERARRE